MNPIGGGDADGPLLFSIKDAAKRFGVSAGILYELVCTGEIEHIRLGRRVLIGRAALDRFIDAHTKLGYYER